MRQLIVKQLDYDLTPVAGLALVGQYLVGPAKLLFARCRCSNRELAFEPHALTPSLEMSQPTDRARLALICTDRSAIGGSSVIWSRHKKAGPMPSFAMARSSQRRL